MLYLRPGVGARQPQHLPQHLPKVLAGMAGGAQRALQMAGVASVLRDLGLAQV